MKTRKESVGRSVLDVIEKKIEEIKQCGFGEITVIIRNGTVYRILSTEDELIENVK